MAGCSVANLLPHHSGEDISEAINTFIDDKSKVNILVTSTALGLGIDIIKVCQHGIFVGFPATLDDLFRAINILYRKGQILPVEWTILTTSGTIHDHDESLAYAKYLLALREKRWMEFAIAQEFHRLRSLLQQPYNNYIYALLEVPIGKQDGIISMLVEGLDHLIDAFGDGDISSFQDITATHIIAAAWQTHVEMTSGTSELDARTILTTASMANLPIAEFPDWLVAQISQDGIFRNAGRAKI